MSETVEAVKTLPVSASADKLAEEVISGVMKRIQEAEARK